MAKYLLNAPDEDMARWKSQAKEKGIPFSKFCREALEKASGPKTSDAPPELRNDETGMHAGKRHYTPDFKS